MGQTTLYQWIDELARRFPDLGKWQVTGLGLLSLGVVWSEHSCLTKIAEKLGQFGNPDSLERRFQRWVNTPRIEVTLCVRWWVRWVMATFEGGRVILLVDETKLGEHLSVMMIGVAYHQRCIPLVWRCYYRHEGQVKMITDMLHVIAEEAAFEHPPLVQADRGIGTSPDLCRAVASLGWHYLFRVQNHTKVLTRPNQYVALQRLVHKPGQEWFGWGVVFKKRGRLRAYVHVLWAKGQTEPWCLVTNDPLCSGTLYARRVWQEESFRDLKSGGWQWQRSRVWLPDHAERLILVLALAYAWTLSYGTLAFHSPDLWRRVTRGTRKRFSIFRCGLRLLIGLLVRHEPIWPGLFFVPAKPLC